MYKFLNKKNVNKLSVETDTSLSKCIIDDVQCHADDKQTSNTHDTNTNNNQTSDTHDKTNCLFYNIYYSNLDTLTNKKCELKNLVSQEEPDIICLTEILNKRDPTMQKSELQIQGYDLFMEKCPLRGVLIYTKNNMKA